jgi:CubicO group peptidase (beta-lactamase class C family)
MTDDELRDIVAATGEANGIPGISACVISGSESWTGAFGTLNVATKTEVTPDSIFQIGSITKVFTGTLIMQLVDEGSVELDAPVRSYLPDLRVAGMPIADAVTVRTLLTHSSGVLGDFFIDTGNNDDALERYIERCTELRYISEPGIFSYCNSGYGMLGRIIESVGGVPWARRLRTALLEPLGIVALTNPEDAMLYRTAAGHVIAEDGEIVLTPKPFLPRSVEAAGARLTMSPAMLLRFAKMHLRNGVAENGTRVLSAESARRMRELQVRTPVPFFQIAGYGLAWAVRDAKNGVVGHNGGTVGQSAFLLLFPAVDVAIAVLTNLSTPKAPGAFEEILHAVATSLGGFEVTQPDMRPVPLGDPIPLLGTYRSGVEQIVVSYGDGALSAVMTPCGEQVEPDAPEQHFQLTHVNEQRFEAVHVPTGGSSLAAFTSPVDGVPRYLFWHGRLAERVPA